VLLSLNQLDFNLTQLKERAEEIAASISYVAKHLEELKVLVSDLRTDIGNRTDITQRFQQERGILKRAKEERDDEYQFVACTRREKKRARVTWKDQS
jgi:chromosome segregation ATPase